MKSKVTIFLCGLAIGLGAVFCFGFARTHGPARPAGYELVFEDVYAHWTGQTMRVCLLVDNQSGDVWRYVELTPHEACFFPVEFRDLPTARTAGPDNTQR